jgi:hypothetical protein
MVIVGAVGEHQVGREGANLADHLPAQLECGLQLAIVIVPGDILGADHATRGRRLFAPPRGQLRAGHSKVSGVAACDRDHLDDMSQAAINACQAT